MVGMSDQNRLRFQAGEFTFSVEAPQSLQVDISTMFSGFRRLDPRFVVANVFTITCLEKGEDSPWTISGPNVPSSPISTRAMLLDVLVGGVNLSILYADPVALHLHAGAVSRNGRGVIVVGESGSGKTTLAATLVSAGWDYITDEMVRLMPGESLITGFPKPLSIRASGADLVKIPSGVVPIAGADASLQVSPAQLGARVTDRSTPSLLLFCSGPAAQRRGAQPTARVISASDAVVALMSQTMDAERFGPGAVEVLSELAARCRSFAFGVGETDLMANLISGITDAEYTHVTPPVEAVSASGRVVDGILTVLIGEEAVVHVQRSGAIMALDPPAAAIWRRLADIPVDGNDVDLHGPVESRFVAQLVTMGLIE